MTTHSHPCRPVINAVFVAGVTTGLLLLGGSTAESQARWPQFRGPEGGVAADDPQLPEHWGPDQNIAWVLDLPGRSWSSPIVWDDHVFALAVTHVEGGDARVQPVERYRARSLGGSMTNADVETASGSLQWILYDIEFSTGTVRWKTTLHTGLPTGSVHQKSSFATETPVTDGQRIYVVLGDIGLFAVDFEGQLDWAVPLEWEPRRGWGPAASPAVHDGRLFFLNDNEEQSFVAAYDTATGGELWRANRDEPANWATPYVWENDVRTELITAGTRGVRSYSLDGDLLWQLTGMSSLVIPTPFAEDGLLYINSGYVADAHRPVYAIRPGASGDITLGEGSTSNDYVVWSDPQLGSYNPSSLVYGDYYYTLLDRGILLCRDARTGREVYPRQRISAGSLFTASPWAYNGKIFALSDDGDTYVIKAGPGFEVLGRNSLNEMALATPAVANGSLILRTASKLYRIARR